MLLICPVRPGENNEELRYAMRSWETNLHLDSPLRLMTVGYCPSWMRPDNHITGNQYKSMPFAVFDNVLRGAVEAKAMGHEDVIYMNDDFFCMDPVGAILPVRRNIRLAEHIIRVGRDASTWWPRSLRLTASWLSEVGFPHPWSYEAHRPLPASSQGMIDALSRWDLTSGDMVPQWRTVYGAINGIEAYPVVDAKLSPKSPGVGTPWLSTTDSTWRRYALEFRKRFPKPSRWEI